MNQLLDLAERKLLKETTMVKRILRYVSSYLPTRLPTGMEEFQGWSDSIISLSDVPDNDSTRFAVAVMILHLGSTEDRKAKRFFVKAMNKGAANEIANAVAQGLKNKQLAAVKAEEEKKARENGLQQPQIQGA